jgi:DNA-directed RNA polymerase subunit RPC12/RpoP
LETERKMMHSHSCPKCHGDLFPEEDEYKNKNWACLQCGNRISIKEMEAIIIKQQESDNLKKPEMLPIPPRPILTGLNLTERNILLRGYYEDNADAILVERKKLGDFETRRRWGFSQCGYRNFLKRRGLVYESNYKHIVKTPEKIEAGPGPEKLPSDTKVDKSDSNLSEKIKIDIVTDCLKANKYLNEDEVAQKIISLIRILDKWHSGYLRYTT